MIKYADAPTGVPTPVEFVDSARVPSVSFQCANVMDDPPVHKKGGEIDTSHTKCIFGYGDIRPVGHTSSVRRSADFTTG